MTRLSIRRELRVHKYLGKHLAYLCPVCDEPFYYRSSMGRHYASKHCREAVKRLIKVGKCHIILKYDPNCDAIISISDTKGNKWVRAKCFSDGRIEK